MAELLEQSEIDRLLDAITRKDDDEMPDGSWRKIKLYDFKRPDKFTKEHVRELYGIFEAVCRNMTTYFSAKLRSLCHFHVASIDQLTYEEFIRSVPTPTTICNALWAAENVALEIDPSITREFLFSLHQSKVEEFDQEIKNMDLTDEQKNNLSKNLWSIFKGKKENSELTNLEMFIMKNAVIRPIFRSMTSAFNVSYRQNKFGKANPTDMPQENVLPRPARIRMESNPQFVQSVFPTEMVILITIETKIGDEEGFTNVCLPYPFVKRNMIDNGILLKEPITRNEYGLIAEPGNAIVSLGQFHINEGKNVAIGDLIPLNTLAGAPLKLINLDRNEIFAEGEVVVIDENFAVRITDVLDEPQNADADYIAGEFGPTIKSGNAYARLGQFTIREDSKFEEGTIVELDTFAGQPTDLVRKGENKPFAQGEIVIIDENFGIRVTELCNS